MLMQAGLSESLAGRFERIPVTHWSFAEMSAAFGVSLPEYLYFGGYPRGAAIPPEPRPVARPRPPGDRRARTSSATCCR